MHCIFEQTKGMLVGSGDVDVLLPPNFVVSVLLIANTNGWNGRVSKRTRFPNGTVLLFFFYIYPIILVYPGPEL